MNKCAGINRREERMKEPYGEGEANRRPYRDCDSLVAKCLHRIMARRAKGGPKTCD
jgi:hypothetical protein